MPDAYTKSVANSQIAYLGIFSLDSIDGLCRECIRYNWEQRDLCLYATPTMPVVTSHLHPFACSSSSIPLPLILGIQNAVIAECRTTACILSRMGVKSVLKKGCVYTMCTISAIFETCCIFWLEAFSHPNIEPVTLQHKLHDGERSRQWLSCQDRGFGAPPLTHSNPIIFKKNLKILNRLTVKVTKHLSILKLIQFFNLSEIKQCHSSVCGDGMSIWLHVVSLMNLYYHSKRRADESMIDNYRIQHLQFPLQGYSELIEKECSV